MKYVASGLVFDEEQPSYVERRVRRPISAWPGDVMNAAISPSDIEQWRSWIGRTETHAEVLDAQAARRYAAALGDDPKAKTVAPALMHWAFFLPLAAAHELGEDGHSKRGGFMPPITLQRRMFAAADIEFASPLRLGEAGTLTSKIENVTHKSGKSGDLVFVDVERTITQSDALCIRERQTIVFRGGGGVTPPVLESFEAAGVAQWRPTTVDLFRFSAVTFNGHRIHYDLPYACDQEGYPGLVVHGPFIAAKLCNLARALAGKDLARFAFRAQAPAFSPQPLYLTGSVAEGEVRAIRCDGVTAMNATFSVQG